MSSQETNITRQVQIDATAKGWRLFRNSVGMAWQGRITEDYTLKDRSGAPVHVVELSNARRVNFGLVDGSSDLVGWRPLVITPDMVGQVVAQFAAVEVKTLAYKKTTGKQDNWLENVAAAGGVAYIARENKAGKYDMTEI